LNQQKEEKVRQPEIREKLLREKENELNGRDEREKRDPKNQDQEKNNQKTTSGGYVRTDMVFSYLLGVVSSSVVVAYYLSHKK